MSSSEYDVVGAYTCTILHKFCNYGADVVFPHYVVFLFLVYEKPTPAWPLFALE